MEKIPITPQMLHTVVKELQKFQLFVNLENLRDYIQRHYPVETDFEALDQELQEKLKYAVCVGLLAKHENDQYYIPTLREETNAAKTAISAFWEMYIKVIHMLISFMLIFAPCKKSFSYVIYLGQSVA